ncbi:hypothetical protein EN943_29270 [Mesorhizobium sp. M7A.F.Ca.US.006.01.1.1]|uniref:NIPSNAP family protein n=1 Tax=Mesorhizobium sp. M7A.F.Ca.US.006.01.1.1 TaxID=2496707 RepID=UPI000FCB4E25|nr:NIPSNAP family protein [Mesorhizobium sp. M7A.F.Ca.US.006.01.1.1]RUZ72787.1 hypothetical protein EN943_29270 [Mesorhizobium sp. M7A.F.Ca.US.006.01.1.1]
MSHSLIVLNSQPAGLEKSLSALRPLLERDDVKHRRVGVWVSDIGLINQIVILLAAPGDIGPEPLTAAIAADPALQSHTVGVEKVALDVFEPYDPLAAGAVFEFRDYRFKPGLADHFVSLLKQNIHLRLKYSPILGWFRPSEGDRERIVSFWPFPSLDARTAARAASRDDAGWLAYVDKVIPLLREQRNWILVPAYRS